MSKQRKESGFTVLEVLLTATILGIAVISSTWSASATVQSKSVMSDDSPLAPMLAREIHELARALPKEPAGTTGATNGSTLDGIDALVNASFSPPIRADGTEHSTLSDWTQQIDLDVYDLDDLTTPSGDDPALGIPEGAAQIYRLSVTILEGNETVDTYQWWVAP